MRRLVFLLEEPSMKEFLENFLPRLAPGLDFICIKHEGKNDLEKSIPHKLRAWRGVDFMVIRDNDGADCRQLKQRLAELCMSGGRPDSILRIACQELEAWYLGVPDVLTQVYNLSDTTKRNRLKKQRNPDRTGNPSRLISGLIPEFRKVDGARRMGSAMPLDETASSSRSFQVFVKGLRKWINAAKLAVP